MRGLSSAHTAAHHRFDVFVTDRRRFLADLDHPELAVVCAGHKLQLIGLERLVGDQQLWLDHPHEDAVAAHARGVSRHLSDRKVHVVLRHDGNVLVTRRLHVAGLEGSRWQAIGQAFFLLHNGEAVNEVLEWHGCIQLRKHAHGPPRQLHAVLIRDRVDVKAAIERVPAFLEHELPHLVPEFFYKVNGVVEIGRVG